MIELRDFTKTVQTFRDLCLKEYSTDIDAINPQERHKRLGDFHEDDLEQYLTIHLSHRPMDLINQIITTPRLLKIILRRVWNTWGVLHGEIDFDDLLVSNVLRFGAPEAFGFILANLNEIRGLQVEGIVENWDDNKKRLKQKWEKINQNVDWNGNAAEELLTFLFPYWNQKQQVDSIDIPQGIRHSDPTDYWRRLNLEEIIEHEVRDQKVLFALNNFKSNPDVICFNNQSLYQALYDNDKIASKVEQFGRIFLNGNEIRDLAQKLFEIILSEIGSAAEKDSSPAFFPLWRLSTRSPIEKDTHDKWILNEIYKALSKSLSFANALYYYWKHNDRSLTGANAKDKVLFQDLRKDIIAKSRSLFANSPRDLIKVLSPKMPQSIYQFSILFSSEEEGGSGFKSNEWEWLMNVLLEAAELDTEVIILQICGLLVRTVPSHPHDKYVYKFEMNLAEELFQNHLTQVMKLFVKNLEMYDIDEYEKQRMVFAKDTAAKWLEKKQFHKNNGVRPTQLTK